MVARDRMPRAPRRLRRAARRSAATLPPGPKPRIGSAVRTPFAAGVGSSTLDTRSEPLRAPPRPVTSPWSARSPGLRYRYCYTDPPMVPLVSVASLVLALAGSPSLGPAASPVDPIVGGQRTGELEYGAIVAIVTSQSALCTGTVVAPRLILTAGHCLAELPPVSNLTVFYGNDLDASMSAAAVGYGAHPEFCPDCKQDIHDYGYVELGSDFIAPDGLVPPITDQEEWDEVMRKGTTVTLVGFGEDPDALASLGTKRKVDTAIRRFSEAGLEFFAGGDGLDSCQGDSGGPALIELESGELRLAGITSRGSDPCGNGGYYGVPFPALTWVRDQTGVDLLPAGCEDGDCLDITPPAEDEGRCAVASPGRSTPPWALLLSFALLLPRRKRSRARRPPGPRTTTAIG
jgi:hypothetical protein